VHHGCLFALTGKPLGYAAGIKRLLNPVAWGGKKKIGGVAQEAGNENLGGYGRGKSPNGGLVNGAFRPLPLMRALLGPASAGKKSANLKQRIKKSSFSNLVGGGPGSYTGWGDGMRGGPEGKKGGLSQGHDHK